MGVKIKMATVTQKSRCSQRLWSSAEKPKPWRTVGTREPKMRRYDTLTPPHFRAMAKSNQTRAEGTVRSDKAEKLEVRPTLLAQRESRYKPTVFRVYSQMIESRLDYKTTETYNRS